MLSLCGFLILIMIGFLFVRKENKSKVINLIKENASLFGMALLLIFFFRGREGYSNINEKDSSAMDNSTGDNQVMKGYQVKTDTEKKTTGDTVMGITQVDYAPVVS